VILSDAETLALRAAVNDWIGRSFPAHRSQLAHNQPTYRADVGAWAVELVTKRNGAPSRALGTVLISETATIIATPDPDSVLGGLAAVREINQRPATDHVSGHGWALHLGDGIAAASALPDASVDLLLTDPPYGISRRYTCENQIPRRLRRDGTDFIMPRGHFGDWDKSVDPQAWTDAVLPKVSGWAVTFCAQAQIGTYCDLFTAAGFVAVGPMVWQKTNPVPFNHQYKPINAWEAIVVGKRPGAPFNGRLVHNVFVHKSPSPQQRIHPTQKPLPLIAEFVDLFSSPGGSVLDPFAGSATTVVAARDARRTVVGYEADPAIFAAAADRLAML
jgi:DNA modification methylase